MKGDSSRMNVAIVDSGVANLASVESAFRSLGASVTRTDRVADLDQAAHIVLPGVGSFAAGMSRLAQLKLAPAIIRHVESGRPLLAVCLGMQLLCDGSDESPGVAGLGIVRGQCRRLPDSVRVPQLGWNRIEPEPDARWLQSGMAAFANSFALPEPPPGWRYAKTTYGRPFVSALERGSVLACQFHPELSSTYGLTLIRRWMNDTRFPGRVHSEVTEDAGITGGTSASSGHGTVRIIPCLDVSDGRVVKGIRFQNLRDAGDPAELAALYERQGADEIVVLDIAAAPRGDQTRVETVRRIREKIHIPLTVGGGVRSVDNARNLLSAGADKISVNSAAVSDPELIVRLAAAFGTQCVVCAIDARRKSDSWEVLVKGGREAVDLNAVAWAARSQTLGAGEILLTSWDRDGTREGADLDLLAAVSSAVSIPVIASGGIGTPSDAAAAVGAGASAVLAASIFHDLELEVGDLKSHLRSTGLEVRT